jgi:ubiquinone/menaquinone biosynthesis C-methylase UbiE
MLRNEKATVREFYETFGWSTDTTGTYNDTAAFVDLRPVLSRYYHDTQMRVGKFLKPRGKYFLDAGSGPLSQGEYLLYSADYTHRVCVDLSARALEEARRKLDSQGLYIVGDVANLPFRDGTFDAVLASHVLYHLPEDEQASTLREFYRTLKSGGTCVVIYIWPNSLITKMAEFSIRALLARVPILSMLLKAGKNAESSAGSRNSSAQGRPPLYFCPHDYRWIRNVLPKHWNSEIRVWRSVGIGFTRRLVADNVVGTVLLRIIYRLEEMFPHASARLGRYPMIVINKAADHRRDVA